MIPQIESVTKMQRDYIGIIEAANKGPVILSQRNKPVAVVLSPAQYDRLAGAELELQRLQRIVLGDQDFTAMRQGKYTEG